MSVSFPLTDGVGIIGDPVNPSHYNKHNIEPIDVIEDWELSFHLGNVIKYICRYKDKRGLEDLRKAQWYLERAIQDESKREPRRCSCTGSACEAIERTRNSITLRNQSCCENLDGVGEGCQ